MHSAGLRQPTSQPAGLVGSSTCATGHVFAHASQVGAVGAFSAVPDDVDPFIRFGSQWIVRVVLSKKFESAVLPVFREYG